LNASDRSFPLFRETLIASLAYLAAFIVTFEAIMPVQNLFFPDFKSRASLLFLPHGVRVLSAWLLGWRSVPALLPGVLAVFAIVAGPDIFLPSRLAAIAVAVLVAPSVFQILAWAGLDLSPRSGRAPCWPCVMGAGVVISALNAVLTNLALDTTPVDFFAYLIGDVFGLFFLMMILMYLFRAMRARSA